MQKWYEGTKYYYTALVGKLANDNPSKKETAL
jgi:hypothetical protein